MFKKICSDTIIKKGDIVKLNLKKNPEIFLGRNVQQNMKRYYVVCSNDTGNCMGPIVLLMPITSKIAKSSYPMHSTIQSKNYSFLDCDSVILAEQVIPINKDFLWGIYGRLSLEDIQSLNKAIKVEFDL